MAFEVPVQTIPVAALGIEEMRDMSQEDYYAYLKGNLIYVDHHDILRSMAAGYPLATTKAQYRTLMAYLTQLGSKVGAGED